MTTTYEQIAADFTAATKNQPAWVRVYEIVDGTRRTLFDGPCEGKRDARRIAKLYRATPWNF
jgi:hypothetical protein